MTDSSLAPLKADELTWRCDPNLFSALRAGAPEAPLIGQSRAIEALRLGLQMRSPGHNIFVCGPSGTGKMSTVRTLLRQTQRPPSALRDVLYVQNFSDQDRPRLLTMSAGQGRHFRKDFASFVDRVSDLIHVALEKDTVDERRRGLVRELEELEAELLSSFEARCTERRFALKQIQIGEIHQIDVMPIYKRSPIDIDELNELARDGARVPKLSEINRNHTELKEELRQLLQQLRREARRLRDRIHQIEGRACRAALEEPLSSIEESFESEGLTLWLHQVAEWLVDNLDAFRDEDDIEERHERLKMLRVNLILDNSGHNREPPIVFENAPTYTNLLGTVERPTDEVRPTVDFTDIKAGSLLRADGGVLVINANDAVAETGVWRGLTRVLKTRQLEIQSPEQFLNPGAGSALKPEPIQVDVKVIVVGDDELYYMLYAGSEDFRRVFKLKAEFDEIMPHSPQNLGIYAHHAWRVTREEALLDLSNEALARLAEHGVRLAGRQDWLSTRFSDLTDVIREAHHYASQDAATQVGLVHIERALRARRARHSMPEDRLSHLIDAGLLDLRTDGLEVGAANALTVVDLGDHVFGQPCRISATCSPGEEGVISVEREVRLSGRLHDKGTLLLTAYLRTHYLPEGVLSLSATVAFEQLHSEVDGDSASMAEAIALLSAMANIPVKQGIAMTGAIDQKGRIQAVGGLNQKIEGFFGLCKRRGLTGKQGVVIPASNRLDLVLAADVIEACREGQFNIWPVSHLDQAIKLTTGEPAGERDGAVFEPGSFNARVQARLEVVSRTAHAARSPGR